MYDDYDYDYENEDYEECEEVEIEMDDCHMKIELDVTKLQENIINSVENNLRTTILNKISNEIASSLKEEIQLNVHELVGGYVKDVFENEVIVSTDKWGENKKEFTLKETVIDEIKNIMTNGIKDNGDRWSKPLKEYFIEKCVTPEIKKAIDKNIDEVRREINSNMKMIFDKATKDLLSDTVMNVLMANDTYKKIETNVASIANKNLEG